MSTLFILQYPDERLYNVAKPVKDFDDELRSLVDNMAETMYSAQGIGLAATQVNVQQRVVVMDLSEERNQLQILINPEIISAEGQQIGEEGCLSIPGFYDNVKRAATIKARAQDVNGKPFELDAEGLLAVCIQHEIDHLNGKLFIQHLSQLKQSRIRAKVLKNAKVTA